MSISIKRITALLMVYALMWAVLPSGRADGIIHNLKSKLTDRQLLVYYQLRGAMDEEVWRSINAGERVGFGYEIQLIKERTFWFDNKVAQLQVESSVKLDTLTNQFHLIRRVNGEASEAKTTTRRQDVESWLTEIENQPVAKRNGLGGSYILQVRAHLKSDFVLYIVPWEVYTPWETINVELR